MADVQQQQQPGAGAGGNAARGGGNNGRPQPAASSSPDRSQSGGSQASITPPTDNNNAGNNANNAAANNAASAGERALAQAQMSTLGNNPNPRGARTRTERAHTHERIALTYYINASMSRHILPYTHEIGAETMWIPLMGLLMLCTYRMICM